ncbi:ABC transporter substrate-binding protein [Halobacteria archaeon AArc-m2/3/4]|uniref:ABC transporter substrate-binding protein n=1 Tax=Natronoglomus mannanivorans TaxID=2979990 RepID=A0AAP3E2X4_9EURY|nr:ABC transporter substrate-binding protein [Halobacteria archaeon AArc-xg1-1]MCU4973485.1 ABC transporter substrate-binding protein [Halobacteria archaeon AArc-m2/3/4]
MTGSDERWVDEAHSRRAVLAGTIGAGLTIGAGCLTSSTDSSENATPISIALEADPTADSWDTYGYVTPYFTSVVEPLVWASESMEPNPWLATDWEAIDETTWEFTLREDVRFHNGETMTAEDVVWSFERLFERGDFVYGWLHLTPENVVAVDDHTVEFETTDPFAAFPGTIAHNMVCVQHPESTDDELGTIGTGPLQVDSVDRGTAVETTPFDDYWGDPIEESLTFEVVDDPMTRALSLESSDVDVIFNPPRGEIESMRDDSDLTVLSQQSPRTLFVPCNLYRAPTDDRTLRRALNYAVSQSELVDTVLEGVDGPARGPISPAVGWGAHDELPSYDRDRDRARQLVDDSAYDGEELLFAVDSDIVNGELIAESVAGAFSTIGVETELRVIDGASYGDFVQEGNAHLGLRTSGSNSAAADYIMFENFHSEGIRNVQLYDAEGTGLYNPGETVDELIETAYQSRDETVTDEAYRAAQVHIMDEAVCIPISYLSYTVATRAGVDGIDLHPIDKMVDWSDITRGGR